MGQIAVTLKDGLKIGETVHVEAIIREPNVGDMIYATVESERMVHVPGGVPQFLVSPALMGLHTLARQIVRIGSYDGPLSIDDLKKLSLDDFSLLQRSVQELDAASLEVAQRGRD